MAEVSIFQTQATTNFPAAEIRALEALSGTDPAAAIEKANASLELATGARSRVELLWIRGQALRRQRKVTAAITDLRDAVALARTVREPRLLAKVTTTLAGAVAYGGDVAQAMAILAEVPSDVGRKLAADVEVQRAYLLQRAGRALEAELAFTSALELMPKAKQRDRADLLANRGILRTYEGRFDEAAADFHAARTIYERLALDLVVTEMVHNMAWLDGRRGHLIRSLDGFDRAARMYGGLGISGDARYPDECEALLAAGLAAEAHARASRSAIALRKAGDLADAAEAFLLAARSALARGALDLADDAATTARSLFEETSRPGWVAEATLLQMEARVRRGGPSAVDAGELLELVVRLDAAGLRSAAADALLLAARAAPVEECSGVASDLLRRAASRRLTTQQRVTLLVLRARNSAARGASRTARRAIDDGARLLDDIRVGLGAPELRAHLGIHGVELADLDVALSLESGRPIALVRATERWRASALCHPRLRPPDDALLSSMLDELRATEYRARREAADGAPDHRLERRARELQHAVLHRTRTTVVRLDRPLPVPSLRALAPLMRGRTVVVFSEHAGHLRAISLGRTSTIVHDLGPAGPIHEEAVYLAASLGRLLCADTPARTAQCLRLVDVAADRLDAMLLAPFDATDDELVMVLPASLAALPWSCVTSLRRRPFTVAPSLALWAQRVRQLRRPDQQVVLAAGPDLAHADDEVVKLGGLHERAITLPASAATPGALLHALDGAAIGHLACHGLISPENPMFSQLLVAGGPLYVYDLERMKTPPELTVLSACHVGAAAARPGDELLGFTASLLGLGGRSVVAAVQAVPDTARTVEFMTSFHRRVAAGESPAWALGRSRAFAADDGSFVGWVFSCFGAG